MSSLLKQSITHFPFAGMMTFGIILFLGVFIGSILWVYRKDRRTFYSEMGTLPLSETSHE